MLLHVIYIVAIVAESMSGAIMGMRAKMDVFGLCVIGVVTALGGGTVRDAVLGHYPLTWVAHPQYLLFTIGGALFSVLIVRVLPWFNQAFLVVDAIGLVAFSIIGCNVANGLSLHPIIAVVAGMLTGICGGVLRDILCNEIPLVLRRDFYACIALSTGGLYMILLGVGFGQEFSTLTTLLFGFLFRMAAIQYRWRLPTYSGQGH